MLIRTKKLDFNIFLLNMTKCLDLRPPDDEDLVTADFY